MSTLPVLRWESAGTDEPTDQNAESAKVPQGCTSAYYSLGPTSDDRWSVEYIAVSHGDEVPEHTRHLGHHATEDEAKAAAARHADGP